ncbi:MAG: methylenetetrahydrofolate reductase [Pseudomonadota bacterium]
MASVSFEYFPPRNEKAKCVLEETVGVLSAFQPDFQSVTYGAGGSNRNGTLDTLRFVAGLSDSKAASHLTYTGSTAREVAEFANSLWEKGIRHIVALRGDKRDDGKAEVFSSTAQFVSTLKRHHPFEIAVSCYPETHPLAGSREADLAVLKEKQDAGASVAISQFFFDNSIFYEFVEEARRSGITIPIVPGILPIYNFEKTTEMAAQCGAKIPDFVTEAFENGRTAGSSELEIAAELLKAQVHDLAVAGFESIHIYTLNRLPLAEAAARSFLDAHNAKEAKYEKQVA